MIKLKKIEELLKNKSKQIGNLKNDYLNKYINKYLSFKFNKKTNKEKCEIYLKLIDENSMLKCIINDLLKGELNGKCPSNKE